MAAAQNHKTANLLLVEDDVVDLETIQRALKQRKIANNIFVANDGIDALAQLRAGKISKPVIILLDINMPRMNGLEFLQALRDDPEHSKHVVFVLTTSSEQSDIFRAYDLNVAGYMLKSEAGDGFLNAIDLLEHYWRVVELPVS